MKIVISDKAAEWYKTELELTSGDFIRFYARYGGYSPIQKGFSLGIIPETPVNPAATVEKEGVTYFVEDKDSWYFDGKDLFVNFNEKAKEPEFLYE
ncbi:HesB/YadR/YfhF family protein [Peribacillus sp. SCS-155]|uniref:HesB/YadR/YfhF family protein n=1 Tax=Peribacillus sedimenti TaxID=3115297 RepID=UPI0039064D55